MKISNHQGWATVQILSPRTTQVSWSVSFEPADSYGYPVREPANLWADRVGVDGVNLKWNAQYYLNAGYHVYLNGALLGYTPMNTFSLRGLDPEAIYTAEVRTVWDDGTASEKKAELKFTIKSMLPREMSLALIEPVRPGVGARGIEINRAVSGRPLSIGGKQYENGIGTRGGAEIEYDLRGLFDSFSALVGVDDGTNNERASVEFVVLGDGKDLWRSGVLKKSDGAKPLQIDVSGVRRLVLHVKGGGDTFGRTQSDWVEATLARRENVAPK